MELLSTAFHRGVKETALEVSFEVPSPPGDFSLGAGHFPSKVTSHLFFSVSYFLEAFSSMEKVDPGPHRMDKAAGHCGSAGAHGVHGALLSWKM